MRRAIFGIASKPYSDNLCIFNKEFLMNKQERKQTLAILLILLLSLLMISPVIVLASNITNALYVGTIRITNNSTANSNVPVPFSYNTSAAISSNFTLPTLVDSSMHSDAAADVSYMPSTPNGNTWIVYVPSINTNGVLDFKLYLGGGTDMGGKIRYFPGTGGMTTADSNMELGDNFTYEMSGYFDTTQTGESITNKDDAFRVYVSGSGNITVIIDSDNLTPTGDSDNSTQWTNEVNIWDDNIATFGFDTVGGTSWSSWIYLTRVGVICTGASWYFTGAANFISVEVDAFYDGDYRDLTSGNISLVRNTWQSQDFPDGSHIVSQYRFRFYNNAGAADARLAEVKYSSGVLLIATGVSPGEHTINSSSTSSNATLSIDGSVVDNSTTSVNVTDNGNLWTHSPAAVMPYVESLEITINGTQRQFIDWEYTTGNFTDDSGNGNDAEPTYRTTSTDADVSAELVIFEPVSPAVAGNFTIGDYGTLVPTITQPTTMYGELDVSHIPGSSLISDVLAASSTPIEIFWFTVPFLVMIVAGLVVFKFTRSIMFEYITMAVVYIGFAAMGPVPLWPVYLFAVMGLAVVISAQRWSY